MTSGVNPRNLFSSLSHNKSSTVSKTRGSHTIQHIEKSVFDKNKLITNIKEKETRNMQFRTELSKADGAKRKEVKETTFKKQEQN